MLTTEAKFCDLCGNKLPSEYEVKCNSPCKCFTVVINNVVLVNKETNKKYKLTDLVDAIMTLRNIKDIEYELND